MTEGEEKAPKGTRAPRHRARCHWQATSTCSWWGSGWQLLPMRLGGEVWTGGSRGALWLLLLVSQFGVSRPSLATCHWSERPHLRALWLPALGKNVWFFFSAAFASPHQEMGEACDLGRFLVPSRLTVFLPKAEGNQEVSECLPPVLRCPGHLSLY